MEKIYAKENNSLRARVFAQIKQAILEETFLPGDSLIEQKLSNSLGVSRTPVREALRQLELEGLVKTIPNKGAVVIGVSKKDIEDIYSIRMQIEALAARWSAENITDEELEELKDVVELQEFYVWKGDTVQVWQLDTKFHEIIYESCRSRPLRSTLTNFHNHIMKARALSFKTTGRAKLAVQEHRAIFEAISARDLELAEKLTKEHILNAKKNLLTGLDSE
ncbi:MAG: GntR family transcriptional regulator [Clostridiales bacterium]|nr:GntR family transcriptional regulator [Clostridiales bacterium]